MDRSRLSGADTGAGGPWKWICAAEEIANVWLAAGWAAGFWIQLSPGGRGAAAFAAGSLLPLALLAVLFWFRMLGAGDIKLLSALGGLMGASAVLQCIFWSFLFGSSVLHRNFICLRQLVAASFIFFPLYQRVFNQRKPGFLTGGGMKGRSVSFFPCLF